MRKRWLVVASWVLWLGWVQPAQASTTRLNQAWEAVVGTQMVFLYYCVGTTGDLYKSKIYDKQKVIRYLGMLEPTLRQEKLFMKQVKPRGRKKNKELFRRIVTVIDFLINEASSLRQYVVSGEEKDWNQFATYRQAAVEDIQYVLNHQATRLRRSYRGGRRAARRHLGHTLGVDIVFGYFFVGLMADGYFHLMISPAQVRQYLGLAVRLLQTDQKMLKRAQRSVPRGSRARVSMTRQGLGMVVKLAKALDTFVRTRNRSALRRYRLLRRQTWPVVRRMGGS